MSFAENVGEGFEVGFREKSAKPTDRIFEPDHRIAPEEDLDLREHKARPYPSSEFDFLAINVPSSFQQGMIPDGEEPPWGMLRVVTAARETYGFESGILDAHRLKLQPEEIKDQIFKTKAKIVGINPTSVNVPEARAIADACVELEVPYILGGIHATLDPRIAREDFPEAIAIVRGNGEVAINEALGDALNNTGQSVDHGIYYKDAPLADRLDYGKKLNPEHIPMVRQDVYIEQPLYSHEVIINGEPKEIHEATLYVTDGCPFACTFCSSPAMVNRGKDVPYARPEIARIADETQHVVDIGGDAIHFLDDMAFIKGDNIKEFHRELTERKLLGEFIWRGMTKAPVIIRKDFGEDVMQMMKETGVWKIALGVESGSDDILKRIKKKVTKKQVVEAVDKLARHDIQVKGFFIMGFPDETEAQMRETYEFIFQLKDRGLTDISAFQFKPYPGTAEYYQLLKTRPEILEKLNYLRRSDHSLSGKAQERAENHVWLPDDLRLAEVSSGIVRQYVTAALENFYGGSVEGRVEAQKDTTCV